MYDHNVSRETPLNLSSPPLTSFHNSRNSAASAQESAYLLQAWRLRWIRLGLSILVVGVTLTIVGCTGHLLHCYNQTHLAINWVILLVPDDVDLKPTLGTMIPAAIITVMSLVYILFSIFPSPHARTLYQVNLFLVISIAAVIATMFALFFDVLLLHYIDANSRETLHTWTCKFYYGTRDSEEVPKDLKGSVVDSSAVPSNFKRLCLESQAGSWLVAGLLVIELGCLAVGIWGYLAERKIKTSRDRYKGRKCESEHE